MPEPKLTVRIQASGGLRIWITSPGDLSPLDVVRDRSRRLMAEEQRALRRFMAVSNNTINDDTATRRIDISVAGDWREELPRGPAHWEINRAEKWPNGKLVAPGPGWPGPGWATRLMWLRVVYRGRRQPSLQWELQTYEPLEEHGKVLGPPTRDPAADFEGHRLYAEELARGAGYQIERGRDE